jgi:cytosine/adenosine deaminase-related metal-dependent hydrolase
VAHHNPYHRRVFESGFPVHVVRRYRWSHSLGLAGAYGGRPEEEIRRTGKNEPFILHLAEGTDETAAAELTRLDSMGALTPRTVIVHGVGLSSSDRALMASRNASMIWCPCSNMFLFNRTADIPALLEQRIPLALGTDSTLSGSATLFDELRFAHGLNLTDPGTLIRMVTIAAARILGLSGRAGCLAPGHTADLLILESRHPNPYINLLEAKPCDIVLVMKDGRPVYGDPASEILFQWTRSSFERISVEKKTRLVAGGCRRLLERLREYRGITLPIDVE